MTREGERWREIEATYIDDNDNDDNNNQRKHKSMASQNKPMKMPEEKNGMRDSRNYIINTRFFSYC